MCPGLGTANMFLNTTRAWTLNFMKPGRRGAETDMRKPKLWSEAGRGQSSVELLVLYGLTVMAAVIILDMHWFVAMVAAPFIMLALLLGVMVLVQVLWMLVVGLDRLGSALGIKKSPLS